MPLVLDEDVLMGGTAEGDCEDLLTSLPPYPTCKVCVPKVLVDRSDI